MFFRHLILIDVKVFPLHSFNVNTELLLFSLRIFFTPALTDVFHWRLSDSKSPQVLRILLSILAVFKNAVVGMVSISPPITNSSSPLSKTLQSIPSASITLCITVTLIFHSFLAIWEIKILVSLSLIFILWSTVTAKSTIRRVLFFLFLFFFFFFFFVNYVEVWSSTRD